MVFSDIPWTCGFVNLKTLLLQIIILLPYLFILHWMFLLCMLNHSKMSHSSWMLCSFFFLSYFSFNFSLESLYSHIFQVTDSFLSHSKLLTNPPKAYSISVTLVLILALPFHSISISISLLILYKHFCVLCTFPIRNIAESRSDAYFDS